MKSFFSFFQGHESTVQFLHSESSQVIDEVATQKKKISGSQIILKNSVLELEDNVETL